MPTTTPLLSALILARNEARHLPDALRSLQGWTDQLVLLDNESTDETPEIARSFGAQVIPAPSPPGACFDGLRNLALPYIRSPWLVVLDADERAPPRLGPILRQKVAHAADHVAAFSLPFKNYFCGRWIRHSGWWPAYCRPQVLRMGRFRFPERLHSGVQVDGPVARFPADDPDLAIIHYTYDDLHHYLAKQTRYTNGEAEALVTDGGSHAWQAQLAHFLHDLAGYYDRGQGFRDGMHGFVLAFWSGVYRFAARAKAWDLRRRTAPALRQEPAPASAAELFQFLRQTHREGPERWLDEPRRREAPEPVVYHGKPDLPPEQWLLPGRLPDLHVLQAELNERTEAEARAYLDQGGALTWQAQLLGFREALEAALPPGSPGAVESCVLAVWAGLHQFAIRSKAWDLAQREGRLPAELPVPASVEEVLAFLQDPAAADAPPAARPALFALPARSAVPAVATGPAVPPLPGVIRYQGPFFHTSGFGDEARNLALAGRHAGLPLVLVPEDWGPEDSGLHPDDRAGLQCLVRPSEEAPWLTLHHSLFGRLQPHPGAGWNVARAMWETDRLPAPYAALLNQFDRVWAPSAFNRDTFTQSGVEPHRLAVVPGCLDPAPFAARVTPWPLPGAASRPTFRFLSVFDWSLHKGWDLLLEAFCREFGGDPGVELWVKTWSSLGYPQEELAAQADACLRDRLGAGLADFPNLHLWQQLLPTRELPRLYQAVDAFVLPTRGEGWCRPLMEAMAAGLPTIATAWSGLTAFHSEQTGFPLAYRLLPVPEGGTR
ncbi:MAG: glycosyltransferase, partial [Armatimonadetes bacterium]|nr:glycosyltransferase [Armatimonadota bacterium]